MIKLMIAVVIIGILAAIGFLQYQSDVLKARVGYLEQLYMARAQATGKVVAAAKVAATAKVVAAAKVAWTIGNGDNACWDGETFKATGNGWVVGNTADPAAQDLLNAILEKYGSGGWCTQPSVRCGGVNVC